MTLSRTLLLVCFLWSATQASNDCSASCGCEPVNVANCCPLTNSCGNVYGQTIYVGRSQHNNFARRVIGMYDKTHLFCADRLYGAATLTIEYQNNFKSNDLATWFSSNGNSSMTYGLDYETDQPGNGTFDVNAINFGVTASGTISFCPTKSDAIADIFLYMGFDEFIPGLWVSLDLPITHSNWNLNLKDCLTGFNDSAYYPTDSVGEGDITVVFNSTTPMKDALQGKTGFGDAPKLKYGKICGQQSETTLANARFDFGYDVCRTEKRLLTASIDFVFPVGTKPSAEYVFDAVVGNYYRWECGLCLMGWQEIWQSCDACKTTNIGLLVNINHVFGRRNERLLGLTISNEQQNTWSQYLLLKKFNSANQATGLERAANILAGDVKVKANVEANILANIEATIHGVILGLGWEFWTRSKEELLCRFFGIPDNTYAIKGSTEWNGDATDTANNYVAPSTTISTDGTVELINANAYISNDNFAYAPALHPSVYSNKVFAYVGKTWQECTWLPFVLVGSEVEIGQKNRTFSTWSIFAKGGIGF